MFNAGGPDGSITFNKALDQSVVLDPVDFIRGFGSIFREAMTVEYSGSKTIVIVDMEPNEFGGTPVGWKYVPGAEPIKGINGLEVVAFSGFTTGE